MPDRDLEADDLNSVLPKSASNPFGPDEITLLADGKATYTAPSTRMRAFLNLMFAVARTKVPPNTDPAINCQITFRDGGGQFGGTLSQTEIPGVLRFSAPAGDSKGAMVPNVMVEQYFCAEDIVRLALIKETVAPATKIWTPGS